MKSFTLLTSLLAVPLVALGAQYGVDVQMHSHGRQARAYGVDAQMHRRQHHDIAARANTSRFTELRAPGEEPRRMQKRCARRSGPTSSSPSSSSSSSAAAETHTQVAVATSSEKATSSSSAASAAPTTTTSKDGHLFTIVNNCKNDITPVFADTSCGYSPRCAGAGKFTGAQPKTLKSGDTTTAVAPDSWVGRVFAQNGKCGAKGEDCTMMEFNLDTGSQWTPQAYDISNIQGFTQAVSLGATGSGCETVTCTSANCAANQAYKQGDMSGAAGGSTPDLPVRACTAGNIGFKVVFCP